MNRYEECLSEMLWQAASSLVERVDSGTVNDPVVVTYALGIEERGRGVEYCALYLFRAMLPPVIKAWREAHKFKIRRWGIYLFPPKRAYWRTPPMFERDRDFESNDIRWKLTFRLGFK